MLLGQHPLCHPARRRLLWKVHRKPVAFSWRATMCLTLTFLAANPGSFWLSAFTRFQPVGTLGELVLFETWHDLCPSPNRVFIAKAWGEPAKIYGVRNHLNGGVPHVYGEDRLHHPPGYCNLGELGLMSVTSPPLKPFTNSWLSLGRRFREAWRTSSDIWNNCNLEGPGQLLHVCGDSTWSTYLSWTHRCPINMPASASILILSKTV